MTLSRRTILVSALGAALTPAASHAQAPAPGKVRIGTLRFGTASWELEVIRRDGLDKTNKVEIEAVELATSQATQVALQAGRVDMILSDFLWVARQRAEGADWTFAPFSSSVGALVAPASSPVKSVKDLKGARLGIAGSPLDKSWLILQAYAKKQFGLDLDTSVTKNFGAPPLIAEQMKQGQFDAILTFWPFAAKAEAAGMQRILGIGDAVKALGIAADIPFVGYVFSDRWAKANATALEGFLAATRQAQDRLDQADDLWQQLKPMTGAGDDSELAALKAAYRHGIIHHWGTDGRKGIESLYAILADIGGPALVGPAKTIPAGTIWQQGAP